MPNRKPQVVFIHGGHSYSTKEQFYNELRSIKYDPYEPEKKRWRDGLASELQARGWDWIAPKMPAKENADYTAWSIWFEKLLPHLSDNAILIGHSLGASFLLRYVSEHEVPIIVSQLHLVAPAVSNERNAGLNDFAVEFENLSNLSTIGEIHIYHSLDDNVVPYKDGEELAQALPSAHFHQFTDRGHFLGEDFPEISANIIS